MVKCVIDTKKQNNNREHRTWPHGKPGDLSFADLQSSPASEEESETGNGIFAHMLCAVPNGTTLNLGKVNPPVSPHGSEPLNLLERVKGQGQQQEVLWAVPSSQKAGPDKIHR